MLLGRIYVSCILYLLGILNFMLQAFHILQGFKIICFKNLCYLVEYILQELYALGISYPSRTFNNSYRYMHIQSFCNYQANQNSEWNCIHYKSIYFFIIILDFCKKPYYINCTLYFIILLNFRTNTHLYLNRHYTFRCIDYKSKYFIFYSWV